jgi:hypothetical protein
MNTFIRSHRLARRGAAIAAAGTFASIFAASVLLRLVAMASSHPDIALALRRVGEASGAPL